MNDSKQANDPLCEDECGPGIRNRYFLGKRMKPDAFDIEQRYHVERRRLLNRAIHGWGVVFGFHVARPQDGKLAVGKGLALDRAGRELLQAGGRQLSAQDVYMSPRADGQNCWLLRVHYAEKREGSLQIQDPCHCQRQEWDYLCETVWYSLEAIPCDQCHACGEPSALCCECVGPDADPCVHQHEPTDRGTHRCLCEHLTAFDPDPGQDQLSEVAPGLRVDLYNGVPLACVTLRWNDCKEPEFDTLVETCGPRRLVKRNDLLFDLIRGADLTRISKISWEDWHRRKEPVEWQTFAAYFDAKTGETGFTVTFSGPVQGETVTVDCFAITVVIPDDEGGWGSMRRMPLTEVLCKPERGDPSGCVRSATLKVNKQWVKDEIFNTHSVFRDGPALVEVEVYGDFILDCCGQAIDANAVGLRRPPPTGNGTPGGSFLSTFRVAQGPPDEQSK